MTRDRSARWRVALPNLFTFAGTLVALVGVGYAIEVGDRHVIWFFFAAACLDAIDGPLARRLGGSSQFGLINDSMTDLVSSGIAPALSLYAMQLLSAPVAIAYALAIQFRLVRFSVETESDPTARLFRGVSAPDCVYLGFLIGTLLGDRFDLSFAFMAVLAVVPYRLFPKGGRLIKGGVYLVTIWLFLANASLDGRELSSSTSCAPLGTGVQAPEGGTDVG